MLKQSIKIEGIIKIKLYNYKNFIESFIIICFNSNKRTLTYGDEKMKKMVLLLTLVSTLSFALPSFAQDNMQQGQAAMQSTNESKAGAWVVGIGGLLIIGAMAGVIGAFSAKSPTTYNIH